MLIIIWLFNSGNRVVAFSVGFRLSYFSEQKAIFKEIYYNSQDVYNTTTGEFEAPLTGVYALYFGGRITCFGQPQKFNFALFKNEK